MARERSGLLLLGESVGPFEEERRVRAPASRAGSVRPQKEWGTEWTQSRHVGYESQILSRSASESRLGLRRSSSDDEGVNSTKRLDS